jgi:sulfopyruvate decarboxylase subunit beta
MIRYDALKEIISVVRNEIIVVNIGHPSQELFSIKDRKRNFYMLGSMGLASSIGLGIAMATSEPVISIDGDGSVLMNLGTLSTIGAVSQKNYILIIIDNKAYGSTGFQKSFTDDTVSLKEIALACNIKNTIVIDRKEIIGKTLSQCIADSDGPYCIIIETEIGKPNSLPIIPHSPLYIKNRLMENLIK